MTQFEGAYVSLSNKPWKDFSSMIEYSKSNNYPLRFGSLGPADRAQIDAVTKATGAQFIPVSIKGGANMMQSVFG